MEISYPIGARRTGRRHTREERSMATIATSVVKWGKFAAAGIVMLAGAANAAEIKVIGSPGVREIYTRLVPEFEKATGHKVVTVWDSVNAVTNRVSGGETADLVLLPAANIDRLLKEGKLAGSRVDVATSGIGVAIREGAPKIDIATSDGIRKALLAAKSIAYSAGPSGLYMAALIAKWGLTDQLGPKIVPNQGLTPIGEVVARGDAEIGFQQISELLPVKGIDYLGPLPAEIQETTVFSAALHKAASAPEAAQALVKFLTAPASVLVIRKAGMEPR
jgi:molybdate transport system substrate-binding protein